jgi:hypothetical protein
MPVHPIALGTKEENAKDAKMNENEISYSEVYK